MFVLQAGWLLSLDQTSWRWQALVNELELPSLGAPGDMSIASVVPFEATVDLSASKSLTRADDYLLGRSSVGWIC